MKVPMMTATDAFSFLSVRTYAAVSLPLAAGAGRRDGGSFIVVVPKAEANLVGESANSGSCYSIIPSPSEKNCLAY